MLHKMALAIVIAYDIYLEDAEGQMDEDWELTYPVDFWTFRDPISIIASAIFINHNKKCL